MQESGIKVTSAPYPDGTPGIRRSLEVMAQKMREGRNDSDVKRWAIDKLRAAGIDGRSHVPIKQQVQILLDALRAQTSYANDPVGTEHIPSAAATLCLRPGLCVRGDDCDGLTVALGSATLAMGWSSWIVKQNFGPGQQEHVLLGVEDESGTRLRADPSTRLNVGESVPALSEEWINPMDTNSSSTATAGAEIVTLGRVPRRSTLATQRSRRMAEIRVRPASRSLGLGDAAAWVPVHQDSIQGGLRYIVAIIAPGDWTSIDVERYFDPDWMVEQVQPGSVKGGLTSWHMQGVARKNLVLTDTSDVQIAQVLGEAYANPSSGGPNASPTPSTPPSGGISATTVVFGALGLATVAGVGWGVWRMRRKKAA